ncbi:DUF5801 domain-containing protein [Bradyrhizobium septentrionale]|uniref:Calcium-binding protein n=1 Tax=Bradyrhizobium septentrionale TaxID=1404411 RepID=A0A973VZX4_9BRAD|nr:DUF5801 repeats-in-toxin domain-containing protein [Bradyrhizobium septentrionale]UGY13362.1 DUF5801 domain-containing protein [Bradyrhizobium septentrionale]UGY21992.1 DUF5801 domain-containing protein [Bradyrhizobium septentrionale]
MQGSFQVAQATGTGNSTNSAPIRIYKLTKPLTDQAVVINLGYDQKAKVDFTSIANEKITLIHVGEKLIILFDNQSTVTVEPFFDSRADGLNNVTIETAPGRDISVQEFTSLFPISTDTSVLPAADSGGNSNGNAQASGANFSPFVVDPLAPPPLNVLAPQEELPPSAPGGQPAGTQQASFQPNEPTPPSTISPPTISGNPLSALIVDESFLSAATNHGVAGSGLGPAGATVATVQVSFDVTTPGGQQSLTYALSVTSPNEDSGLIDTATGQHVLLTVNAAGVVEGRTAVGGDLVLTVSVDATGHVTLTDLRAVHEGTPGDFNEGITLASGLITLTATVTDNNNQTASASVDVGSHLTILDDGPVAGTVTGATDTLVLDETRPVGSDTAGGTAPTGLASVTADFSNNFTSGSYGADGAGSTAYTLKLTGVNVASGLYALDPTDTNPAHFGQGAQIVLNQVGDTITGSANGTTYFTITINETTGIVTFTQVNNIWHADPTNPDDAATLTLSSASLLQVVQTITDADGDSATTPINLGGGVFTIQDSGPTAGTVIGLREGFVDALVLDESRPVGSDTAGGISPTGLASVTADFSLHFTAGSYGSDGPGNTAYTLKLTGANVASGLYALDPTDTTTADGDGIGQGAQIVLNQVGNTITGSVGATTYFTITIDPSTGIVTFTQSDNIWHSDPKNPDDAATLTLSSANLLQVVQTITDADGDHVTTPLNVGTGVFVIQDSGPTAGTVTGAIDTLVLDETRPVGSDTAGGTAPTGLDTVTADFSHNFTGGSYGSDGAGHTAYTLNLAGVNVASGLYALDATDTTTADGDGIGQGAQILLNQVGNTITGSVGATTYFTITIDPSTGIVTFTQSNNIWHSDPTNPDDAATLTLSAANLLQLVQTITDADGDSVTTPLDLGAGVFTIQDSGPTAGTVTGPTDTLVLDETRPVGTDTAGGTAPTGLDTVTADFSNNFTGGSYGSDGAGNTAYTLKLTGANVASGLFALDPTDTDPAHFGQGAQIVLNQSGDTITGSVGATTYFTITIDETTGIVTFTQLNNIWHSDPNNPDDAATLTLSAANLLQVVQTITDADGDHVTTPLDLGAGVFTIQDSGPTAGTVTGPTDTLVLDETRPVGTDTAGGTAPTGLDTVTADFSNNFTGGSYGSDGAGNTAYTLKLTGANVASGLYALDPTDTDPAHFGQGAQIVLNQVGDTITGSVGATTYFTITIDETTGIVTFTQLNNIWHSDPTNPDDAATLTLSAANLLQVVQTITDADGDHVATPLDLGSGVFTIQDSGPTAGTVIAAADTLVLDETRPVGTDTAGGTAPTGLDAVTADFSNNFTGGSYGSDGPGNTAYTLKLTGVNVASGLYALDPTDTDPAHFGQGAQIVLNQVGDTITGSVGATTYFTITINETTGIVTFTQSNNIWHSDPTNPDDAATLTLSSANLLQVVQTITDADGDHVTTPLNLGSGVFTIQDSGPTAGTVIAAADTLVLDETRPVGTDTAGGTAPTGLDTVTADFSNNFSAGSYGSDGPGNTAYTLKLTGVNVASGLYALDPTDTDPAHFGQGAQIVLNQVGDTITGSVGATTYFTITINETTGIVTFTQSNNIWHSDPTNPDDAATLTLSSANLLQVVQTITDADGDHVATPLDLGSGVFTIQDSGPTAGTVTGPTDTLVLDETRPVGTDTAGSTAPTGLASVTADFSNNFTGGSYGSDGAGNTAYTLKLTGVNVLSGLFALDPTDTNPAHFGQGAQIVLNQVGDTITGSVGATTYFTITINETTGIVTFTQVNNIWHADPTNPDDAATLTLSAANLLQVVQTITDADGDHVTTPLNLGTGVFTIQDSGPTAGTVTGPTDTLVLDETRPVGTDTAGGTTPTGLASVTADFSNNFTGGSYGSDGPGNTAYTLKLTGANVASGLYALDATDKTTADGDGIGQGAQIVLNQSGNTIIGSVGATVYFTITIDPTTGIVTFTQSNNIWHSDPNNPDDAATLTLSAANLLQVVQTITDADGDSVSTSLDLGTGVFTIQDSGPTAPTATVSAATLGVDETPGVQTIGGASDVVGSTAITFNGSATTVAGLFATVASKGVDTDVSSAVLDNGALSFASTGASSVLSLTGGSYGSDGAGSTVYALSLLSAASGLTLTDGTAITLSLDGSGRIIGTVGADAANPSLTGQTAFAIAIDPTTGQLYVADYLSLHHNSTASPNDVLTMAAGKIGATVTLTDADGDHVTASADISTHISFLDDGPTLGAFVNGTLPNDIGSVNGTFAVNFGADGFGGFTLTGPAISGITYSTVALTDAGGHVIGSELIGSAGATQVFDLKVFEDGTYTFDLLHPQASTSVSSSLTNLASGHVPWAELSDGSIEFTSPGDINSSTNGLGVGNNFLNGGETFTMEFHVPGTGVGVDDAPGTNPQFVDAVNFTINSGNPGDMVSWIATDTVHGTTQSGTATVDASGTHLLIDPTISFNTLQITGVGNESIRLLAASISKTVLPSDQNLTFGIVATDGDGDSTASSSLGIHVVAGDSSGNFTLTGGATADVIATSSHTDTVNGGAGTDIVDYRDDTVGVTVNLTTGLGSGGTGSTAVGDTYTSIEGILGGSGNDTLTGLAAGGTYFDGGAGSDTLNGGAGNDTFVLTLNGGGHDTINNFNGLSDQIFVNLGDNLSIGQASTVDASNFHVGDETQAATWNGGTGKEFVFNTTTHELWYSANGTGTDKVDLAHVSTGVPAAANVHVY